MCFIIILHSLSFSNQLYTHTSDNMIRINFPYSYLGNKHTSYGLHLYMTLSLPYYSSNSLYLELFSIIDRVPTRIKRPLSLTAANHTVSTTV